MKNVVRALRLKANAWYENAISRVRTQKEDAWKQAEGQAKRLGIDGEIAIEIVWSTWKRNYALFLSKKGKFLERELLIARSIEDGTDLPPRILEPTPVESPESLMSASMGKALQVTEMFCLWFSLCEERPTWLDGRPMLLSDLVKQLDRLTLALIALYVNDLAEDWLKIRLSTFDAISKSQTELPSRKAPFREHSIRSRCILPGLTGYELGLWITSSLPRCQGFVFWMKRGAPQVGENMVMKQEEASLAILSSPQERADVSIRLPQGMEAITLERLELEVRRTVRETFKGAQWSPEARFQLPSSHAHITQTRDLGGARSLIASRQPALVSLLSVLTNSMVQFGQPLAAADCDGLTKWPMSQLLTTRAQFVQEARKENGDYRLILTRIGLNPDNEEISGSPPLTHFFDELCYRIASRDILKHTTPVLGDTLPAKIIGLREPLKVRTITAGPEEAYYFATYIQKFVHNHLRKHSTFRLIGGELMLDDIKRTFSEPLRTGDFYVSGDYKSATDLISARLSEACAREIGEVTGMPPEVIEMFVLCLVGHDLTLGKKKAIQRNGQLMGSPASFPILCVINAALTRFALELRYFEAKPLGSFPMLINGDDVGFITDQEGYEIWKLVTRCGGLQFSLGKNFTSRSFLVINSCMFELGPILQPRPMRPSYPKVCGSVRHKAHVLRDWIGPSPEESPCHGGCPYRGTTPDEKRPLQEARPRQCFFVSHYVNPDYLGPSGRWVPLDEGPDQRRKRWSSLPAFQRLKVRSIDELFLPEGYAILPGLQKAWLGRSTGPRRHQLNEVFLSSWKPVLELSRFFIKQKRGEKVRRHTLVTPDWFLPIGLGGLGLENTERFGVFLGPLRKRNLSGWNAKLAFHILYRPWLSPAPMPTIDFPSFIDKRVSKRLREYTPCYAKPNVTLPRNSVTPGDLLAIVGREEWMKTFQMELEIENPARWQCEPPPEFLGFSPNLGKRCSLDRASLLKKALRSYQMSRQKLYGDMSWISGPEISEAALAGYLPSQCYYNLSTSPDVIVQLGNELTTLPLVGVAERPAGFAEILTPPIVTEAGLDPGTWRPPVFGQIAEAILRDRPLPFGLRQCS